MRSAAQREQLQGPRVHQLAVLSQSQPRHLYHLLCRVIAKNNILHRTQPRVHP